MKRKEDFKSFKMDKGNVKLLTGIEADLYVFTIEQLNEVLEYYHQEKKKELDINQPFFGNSGAKYDESYLNECIEKAKPNLSKIGDVDKALDEIRGDENLGDRYASRKPVIKMPSDEEIEKDGMLQFGPTWESYNIRIAWMESAKWMRSQIKLVTK